jgi:hypothetical protein
MEPTIFYDDPSSQLKLLALSDAQGGLPPRPPMPKHDLAKEDLSYIPKSKSNSSLALGSSVLTESASDRTASPSCEAKEPEAGSGPELLSPKCHKRIQRASIKAAHHNLPSYIYAEEGVHPEIEQADLPKRGVRNRKLPDAAILHNHHGSSPSLSTSSVKISPSSSPLVLDSSALIRPPWEAST